MNSTIWKFKLNTDDAVLLTMPIGAEILTVEAQDGWPCLWAAVDPEALTQKRTFTIHGTGHHIKDLNSKRYVGTFFLSNGLVFHTFEAV